MKLRKDSFAARLSAAQKDELFALLAAGKGLAEAAAQVHEWTKGEWGGRAPSTQAISAWFAGARVERRFAAAKEAALITQANCPEDFDEQARRALGQAKFLATLEELSPTEVAQLERNELLRQKLDLQREQLHLDQEKFCRLILGRLTELQEINREPGLDDNAKLERVRQRLFGFATDVPTLAQVDARKGATP